MARPKVSLSNLLDGETAAEQAPPPQAPKVLAAAPALPKDDAPPAAVPMQAAPAEEETADDLAHDAAEPEPVPAADATAGEAPAATAAVERQPVRVAETKPSKPRPAGTVRAIKAAPEPPPLPLYLELTRKEARFRQDQLNDLTTLTRQLNRRRASTGERITDNTLIRVAVDMMLKVADSLDGITESELLAAVSAKLKR